jgi:ribosomal protein S18 acetylase RimI-like enzyme
MEPLTLTYGPITDKTLGQFKKINEATLAVNYSEKFYLAVIAQWKEFSFFAYASDLTIGSISSRREIRNDETCLYVMTCSVLKPYRHLKIGSQLVKQMETKAIEAGIKTIFLHVWTASVEAFQFYSALSFEKVEEIEDYYQELTPQSAYILSKTLF